MIHSVLRTMACGTRRAETTARTMVVLQVAEMPWMTRVDGLGTCGFFLKKKKNFPVVVLAGGLRVVVGLGLSCISETHAEETG